jgi:hypothetical protein
LPVMIAGFSVARLRTATTPRWLGLVGLTAATLSLFIAFGMAWAVTGGWAAQLRSVAQPIIMVWVLSISVLMIRRYPSEEVDCHPT